MVLFFFLNRRPECDDMKGADWHGIVAGKVVSAPTSFPEKEYYFLISPIAEIEVFTNNIELTVSGLP